MSDDLSLRSEEMTEKRGGYSRVRDIRSDMDEKPTGDNGSIGEVRNWMRLTSIS